MVNKILSHQVSHITILEAPLQVKVLRSIERLGPSDVILGQYRAQEKDKVDISAIAMTPTYFAAALYINNARWDGVPFMIRAGTGLMKHRYELMSCEL